MVIGSGRLASYHYEPLSKPMLPRYGLVDVVVWPPDKSRESATDLGLRIDREWTQISSRLPRIIEQAGSVVHDALSSFWRIDDEPPPSSSQLLGSARLIQVGISLAEHHELILHDEADLIGSHDLILKLDSQYRPCSANFDG